MSGREPAPHTADAYDAAQGDDPELRERMDDLFGKDQPEISELERLRTALQALPDRERQAFLLARFEGCTRRQIALTLRCTPIEARDALVNALTTLQRAVDQAGPP